MYSLRRRNHRKDVSSSEFEEGCFETAIIDSTLYSNPILIKPFHQNLNPQQQRPTKTTTRLEDERRDITTTSPPATIIINNYSSEGYSGSILPEQWQLTRMRRRDNTINRADANMIRDTHPVVIDPKSTDGQVPTSINLTQPSDKTSTTINLTPIEKKVIEAQDKIGLNHFIRGRTANEFAPVILQYYTNNKIRSFSTPLRWSIAINKYNFLLH